MNAIKELGLLGKNSVLNQKLSKDKPEGSFKEVLKDAFNDVNDLQHESKKMVTDFLNGDVTDVHQVMVAAEKASVGLDLTMQIRNKLVEAYREVMRMTG